MGNWNATVAGHAAALVLSASGAPPRASAVIVALIPAGSGEGGP